MTNEINTGRIFSRGRFRNLYIVLTSIILLSASLFFLVYFQRSTQESKIFEFERVTDQMISTAERGMSDTVNLLYVLRSVVSEDNQTSSQWENFILESDLEVRYPGVYSLGYAEIVKKADLNIFEAQVREMEKGVPAYSNYYVFPKSGNNFFYPLKFIHTTDRDISVLLGFDLGYAEEVTTALAQSIETGEPKISDRMPLKTIIPSSSQEGYLVLVPVYSLNAAKEFTVAERKNFLIGLVGAWMTPKNLMRDLKNNNVNFDVYDGSDKVYSFQPSSFGSKSLTVRKQMKLLNKTFDVVFSASPSFRVSAFEENLLTISLSVAAILNLMWYITVYLILSSRGRAIKLAQQATSDLTKFKQAVDGVSDHVIITNPGGVIIYANKAASKITGYSNEEMLGRTPALWGKQMPREYYEQFWKTIKTEKRPFVGQLLNRRKTGELYDVEISVSPILDNQGNLEYFVGIERDITKQKAVDKMKSEFISLASHQLRTPLSAVKWFGKMLVDGDAGNLNELQKQYMTKINESNEREIKLVNSLLNVSRIESGRIVVEPKPTNMKDLVEAVVSEIKLNVAATKKQISWEVEENVPTMNIDADLVRHVFINLLTNSVRYTGDDGKIDLRVSFRAGELVCEVKDNGIGIPAVEQDRLFEKFFRASNATKKETDGNGLGLFLAKAIVESSGGKIGFVSKEGEGTTFWFTLPVTGMKRRSGELTMV